MDIAQLVAEHHQVVYRYAFRLTGAVPDAEDLTQQVFLAAQQNLGQLRKQEAVRSWLFAVLRNAFLKMLRQRRPQPAANLDLNLDHVPAEIPDEDGIDGQRLQRALDELPENYRLVVVMYFYEDASYREIAEQLEIPMGTVMSRLARAKQHLRARLSEADVRGETAPLGAVPHRSSC